MGKAVQSTSTPATPSTSVDATGHTSAAHSPAVVGVLYGLAAYGAWGVMPVFYDAIRHVPTMEILAHRVAWSVIVLWLLLLGQRRWRAVLAAVRSRRVFVTLLATTVLISVNWFTFTWAVTHDFILQASLGYYINPLVNVALGFIFLRERLHAAQWIAVLLAGTGVAYMTLTGGTVPTIALVLAFTFGFFGLLRKTVRADAIVGLTVETTLLLPIAVAYILVLQSRGEGHFGTGDARTTTLLALAGVVTALPLIWFAHAAKRLRLATIGLMQYIAPTGQFLLAVLLYGESFTRTHAITFAMIWSALALYTTDTVLRTRRTTRAVPPAA